MQGHSGRKRVKGLSLVGHEEVLHGFGLIPVDSGETADGGGDCGRHAQLSTDYWVEPGV